MRVHVELDPIVGCGNCAAAGGCGLQLLPTAQTPLFLDCAVNCDSAIAVGDQVRVHIADPDSRWLRVVGKAYGMPTMGMIIGAIVGYWVATALQLGHARELVSLVGFIIGLTGGLIAWDRTEKSTNCEYLQHNSGKTAKIVDVVTNSGEVI